MIRFPHFNPLWMAVELAFSALVIVLCLMIFFRTKELYRLTKHKGISYFRYTFLFFALAFLFRFAFHLFSISGMVFDFRFPRQIFGPLPLLFTSYFSTVAILYLLMSLLWKSVNTEHFLAATHVVALSVAVLAFLFRLAPVICLIQLIIIVATLVLAYVKSRHSKGFSRLFMIYALLFVGWVANVFVMSPGWRIPFGVNAVSYVISAAVFGVIFYKVYRWTK